MKELEINANEAGQRFDKYLKKYLKEAPDSFRYKMLRKKNIVLNGKKADGREKLAAGDRVKLFLSEETVEKFSGGAPLKKVSAGLSQEELCHRIAPDILYEDSHVLLVNKPSGVLSQKAASGDISMVEYVTAYLLENGQLAEGELRTFRPSVCNRLDRNTSGIIAAGKSLAGLQALSELFRERGMGKYYLCIVRGELEETAYIRGFLKRDMKAHKVRVSEEKEGEDWLPIETEYIPLAQSSRMTLLKVHLITGRTHQIRVHFSWQGHPLFNDERYGGDRILKGTTFLKYKQFIDNCFRTMPRHALHARSLGFVHPATHREVMFESQLPEDFRRLIDKWETYSSAASGDLSDDDL